MASQADMDAGLRPVLNEVPAGTPAFRTIEVPSTTIGGAGMAGVVSIQLIDARTDHGRGRQDLNRRAGAHV